jgi:alanyl-tRNA synthetase
MPKTNAAALRQGFLDYFARHGHTIVKSSSLLPANDPTLMFTNAGMVQFKDVFVGEERRPYKRATSCQKCLRVSGKHNDLEEVGRTARHHTFFEMLGNFSFGDYFKEEAIELAWQLVTREWALDPKRLWVTVFGGEGKLPADNEARSIWRKVSGLPEGRILDKGMKDNFWAMGETGPCGPCTEIHYDMAGGGEVRDEDFDNGRLVEIWNNVFMQFERKTSGELVALPKPCVDTGMGLERITAIVQGEKSNYHSDLFMPLIDTIAAGAGKRYGRSDSDDDISMRVIADHARTTAFLVADGVQPSNEGRGYVMRRIMRRAIRHGRRLGFDDLFLDKIADKVVDIMGEAYPELVESRLLIGKVAELEERNFRRTLDTGLRLLEEEFKGASARGQHELAGSAVFRLYDTYGFPKDLTEVIARERGFALDEPGFEAEMAAQQERSRGGDVGEAAVSTIYKQLAKKLGGVQFVGYTHEDEAVDKRDGRWRRREAGGTHTLEVETKVRAVIKDGATVESASEGVLEVVLDPTPFYGESGGQVGDAGVIVGDGLELEVLTTVKPVEGLTVSKTRLRKGSLRQGATVWAGYVPEVRKATRAHHSATHLLHGALRKVLGSHVKQAGSLVDAQHLRFDYAHFEAPSFAQLRTVEDDANARVARNDEVTTDVLPFAEAKKKGALAFFGDKYGEIVRVISMGESVEFCGGTHAKRTGDIGVVLITHEEAVASGVRRLEAEVGEAARHHTQEVAKRLREAAAILSGRQVEPHEAHAVLLGVAKAARQAGELAAAVKAAGGSPAEVACAEVHAPSLEEPFTLAKARAVRDLWQALVQAVGARAGELDELLARTRDADTGGLLAAFAALQQANRENERRLEQVKRSQLTKEASSLTDQVREVGGVRLLTARLDGVDGKGLRELADQLRQKLGSGVLCLGSEVDGKANLLVTVTKDLAGRLHAGKLIVELAPLIGGKGGGKPDLAQAGGSNPQALDQVFAKIATLIGG